MQLGIFTFPTDISIQPADLATAVEERGFESLWFPEHSHIPVSRRTPWGGSPDAPPLPEMYYRTYDQFVALSAIASVTTTLRLGTAITLAAQRDPIWLAKEVASLDTISAGRVLFGIGYGWNKEEMAHHSVRYTDRRAILREKILSMQELWTQEEASFSGEFVRFEPSKAWPKPVQDPYPPVILGADAGPRTFSHIVEFCDGWMPIYRRYDVDGGVTALRRAAEQAGRDPATIELGVTGAPPDPAKLERLAELGFSRAVIPVPSSGRNEVLPLLDEYATLVATVGGYN